ncbi:hypothetical protein [Spongiivirga citrea]|uniref:Uncharacterized protein n=1 Tax=Spongiivirga citrea TaxID=1481457 RepID=A0A6M0CL95_9FLAO|nr:hypothetical protein [Spongiivirga citrea]NER18432.1 hypothetical protein [Spongiivirga citrea]
MKISSLLLFLFAGVGFAVAQQKRTFKVDSSEITDKMPIKQIDLLNSEVLGLLFEKIKKNPEGNFVLEEGIESKDRSIDNMPIYKPKGHFKFRIFELDSTTTNYLRIVKPK